jgi:heme/copper-type cytochrome/quinol oxidase subunit 2
VFVQPQDLPFVSLAAISWRNALNQALTLRPHSTSFLYPLAHNISLFSSAPLAGESRPARSGFMAIREDVGSIRRLRVTRGVCLPSDVALHGIFGSKDVIHSWAIPGLGIKIDCIPGYNSHRRVLLR